MFSCSIYFVQFLFNKMNKTCLAHFFCSRVYARHLDRNQATCLSVNRCLFYTKLPAVVSSTSVVTSLVTLGVVSKKTQKQSLSKHQLDLSQTAIDRYSKSLYSYLFACQVQIKRIESV